MPRKVDYPKIIFYSQEKERKKKKQKKLGTLKQKLKNPLFFLSLFFIFLLIFSYFSFFQNPKVFHFSSKEKEIKKEEISDNIGEFGIKIDKIDVLAPVILEVDGADKEKYMAELEKGVAHFKGTFLPSEGSNIFIFGHSSTTSGRGPFAKIFARLGELERGDKITVFYQDTEYVYSVFEKKVVEKTELGVLDPTREEQLTLMTCWPVGTIDKRLIIKSSLIE